MSDAPDEADHPAAGDAGQLDVLTLTSPAFSDGGAIPNRFGYREHDVNPPLTIEQVPDDAESLVLIVDDPDAVEPAGKVWDHWLVCNIDPDHTEIPEDWGAPNSTQGENDYGEVGYGGPNPPDGEHTYRFKLYALDTTLDVPEGATKAEIGEAMEGHVIARTQHEGTYAP